MKRYYCLYVEDRSADIYIFGDIVSWPWLESDVSSYGIASEIAGLDVDTITVHINSYGGEVAEGLAIHNSLKSHKAKIITVCDGFACSAASIVFMAGDERIMNNASLLMIHNVWTYAAGDAADLRKAAEDIEKMSAVMASVYAAAGVTISDDELSKLLDAETWLSPQEALEYGFAGAIIGSGVSAKAAASARVSAYKALLRGLPEPLWNPVEASPGADPDVPNPEKGAPPDTPGENKMLKFLNALL
jgi:ATP-dependent Clp endopeptidase proteolytic subunit ClpP